MNYYSYGEHCWVFFNTKWRASNTFEATVADPPQVNMEISISNTVLLCRSNVIKGYKRKAYNVIRSKIEVPFSEHNYFTSGTSHI